MNTGKDIYDAIEMIAATSSKLEKEKLIKHFGCGSLFMNVLRYAYDPFKTYGIRTAPHRSHSGPGELPFHADAIANTLDALISRKLSGGDALLFVQKTVDVLDPFSAEVFRRIIAKDLRAGFGANTINKVFKGTFPEFPYMRCTLPKDSNMSSWDWDQGVYEQEKADGMFANVNLDYGSRLLITSRQGQAFPEGAFGELEPDLADILQPGTQTHGEMLVFQDGQMLERHLGNGILNSLADGGKLEANQRVEFHAWDQIPLSAVVPKGVYSVPHKQRFAGLSQQLQRSGKFGGDVNLRMVDTWIVHSKAEAFERYRQLLAAGREGVVCKHPNAIWRDTGSSGNKDQVKLKLDASFEVRVKGFNPGKPGTKREKTFGSIQVASECGRVEFGVGIGLSDKLIADIHANRESYLDRILTVSANGIMSPSESNELYSAFLPKFGEVRNDKVTADTLEQIQAQFEAAMEAA